MAVKVLSMDEPRDIESGGRVCEGLVGDETGTIVMSFWNEECDQVAVDATIWLKDARATLVRGCFLYTSPSPRDATRSRMPSSA